MARYLGKEGLFSCPRWLHWARSASRTRLLCKLLTELPLTLWRHQVQGCLEYEIRSATEREGEQEEELCPAFFAPFDSTRATGIACFFAAASHRRPGHALNFKAEFAVMKSLDVKWPLQASHSSKAGKSSAGSVCSPITGMTKVANRPCNKEPFLFETLTCMLGLV